MHWSEEEKDTSLVVCEKEATFPNGTKPVPFPDLFAKQVNYEITAA
ncbi:hypothetical protein PV403_00795 [Paenibacillus sp. GYB006]